MKKYFLKYTFFLILVMLPVFSLAAKDIGLILDQSGTYNYTEELHYYGSLIPWLSVPLGNASDLHVSAGITVQYEFEEWKVLPELFRTEFTHRWEENGEIKIGRMFYSEPLGFIAGGLFDGVRYVRDLPNDTMLGMGVWYTGFLYKKNANITMTSDEMDNYNSPVDYANFSDTYFAPRRLFAAVDWEHPGFMEIIRLHLAFVGQFDLSGSGNLYHSQYLIAKAAVQINSFIFELGACAGLAENAGTFQVSFAGEAGIAWMLPTQINDRLLFLSRFSGGTFNKTFVSFVPITTELHGGVLKSKLSGISMFRLDYTARLHETFSFGIQSSYFIRSDLEDKTGMPNGPAGYLLGNEFFFLLRWSPISDLSVNAGGGIFLPSLGNVDKKGDVLWNIDFNIVLALY